MKQVLVNSNKTYLFPLPETFDELLTNIINKVNTNNITIYHKSKVLTKYYELLYLQLQYIQ